MGVDVLVLVLASALALILAVVLALTFGVEVDNLFVVLLCG